MPEPLPLIQVMVWFDVPASGNFFTLDHPDKGELDQSLYLLGGDTIFHIGDDVEEITINRGRSRQLDEIPAGTGTVQVTNPDRDYDPFYTSSPYAGNMVPGRRIRIQAPNHGAGILTGFISDWQFDYDEAQISSAVISVEDGLAVLGRARFTDWTTTSELPGVRIDTVLDRPEVAWPAVRDIRDGVETLQADNVSFGSNVLNYLQLVAKSDHGRLFYSRSGYIVFYDRTFQHGLEAEFADDGTGIPFARLAFEMGSQFLYNRVTVDREGGIAQTVSDMDSVDEYGWRPLEITGLLLNTDTQSLALANYLLNKYKQPEVRVASLELDLAGLEYQQQTDIITLDLGSLVSVTFTPDGIGTPITQLSYVEGISHRITASSHKVELSLGAAENSTFFLLDDLSFGRLDAGNQLAF